MELAYALTIIYCLIIAIIQLRQAKLMKEHLESDFEKLQVIKDMIIHIDSLEHENKILRERLNLHDQLLETFSGLLILEDKQN